MQTATQTDCHHLPNGEAALPKTPLVKTVVLAFLNFYRGALSPGLPSACKFYPTCSAYAVEAVERYGPVQGLWLAAKRLLRCRPLYPGGYDPVP